jgi:Flp pilus assembly protein TadB
MATTLPDVTSSARALQQPTQPVTQSKERFTMHSHLLLAATLLATTANNTEHFSIGPWIIVPILILAAIVAVPVYVMRDRRKRRGVESGWSKTDRR